jgi:hypothetical protein
MGEEMQDILVLYGEDNELTLREAKIVVRDITKLFNTFKPRLSVEVGEGLTKLLKSHAAKLLDAYAKRITDILDELQINEIEVSAVSFADGEVFAMRTSMNQLVDDLTESKEYVAGYTMVDYIDHETYTYKNTNKKWYKPWTWFEDSYETGTREVVKQRQEEVIEIKQYVPLKELYESAFANIMDAIREFSDEILIRAGHGFDVINKQFNAEKAKLNGFIHKKTDELSRITSDKKDAERVIKETQERKVWLEGIQAELNSILDI